MVPSRHLADVGDRHRARLLAAFLLVFIVAGVAAAGVQYALVPEFLPAFRAIVITHGILFGAYALSRTRHYRLAGAVATVAVIVTSTAVPWLNPQDFTWHGFLGIGLILATTFLPLRVALGVALLSLAIMVALPLLVPEFRDPGAIGPPIIFYLVFAPLVLVVARHRDRLEEARRQVLLESQAAAAESQRLETLGRLAGSVAHDFRNILSTVSSSIDLLRLGGDPSLLDDMKAACRRSDAIVQQLLAFARRRPITVGPITLQDVVLEYEPILRRLVGVGVALDINVQGRSTVLADPTQLGQALLNLVVNARDACGPNGTIRVAAAPRVVPPGAAGTFECVPEGGYACIQVDDDGHGIPEAQRYRIFEPFFSTKPTGTGLGLATVHGCVKQMHGHVTVRSAPGEGASFTIFLPLASEGTAA